MLVVGKGTSLEKMKEPRHPLNLDSGYYSSRKRVRVRQLIPLLLLVMFVIPNTVVGQQKYCTPFATPPLAYHCSQMCAPPFFEGFPVHKPNPDCIALQLFGIYPGDPTPEKDPLKRSEAQWYFYNHTFAVIGVMIRLVPDSPNQVCLLNPLIPVAYALQAVDEFGYPIGTFYDETVQPGHFFDIDETTYVKPFCKRDKTSLLDIETNSRQLSFKVCDQGKVWKSKVHVRFIFYYISY